MIYVREEWTRNISRYIEPTRPVWYLHHSLAGLSHKEALHLSKYLVRRFENRRVEDLYVMVRAMERKVESEDPGYTTLS